VKLEVNYKKGEKKNIRNIITPGTNNIINLFLVEYFSKNDGMIIIYKNNPAK
jgi:hypothetical protein